MDGEKVMMAINDTADGNILDDLLESIEMLGKTATEIGIPREVINTEKSYYIKTYIDGYIFGTKDYAYCILTIWATIRMIILRKVFGYTLKVGYDECKDNFLISLATRSKRVTTLMLKSMEELSRGRLISFRTLR